MAEAGRVVTLYEEAQRKMAYTISVYNNHFRIVEETLASMEPMVREIDQSNQRIIQLLRRLINHLPNSRLPAAVSSPHYGVPLKLINEELNRFLRDYVQLSLSNIDHEVGEDDLRQLLNHLLGMLVNEGRRSADESTKLVFKILDLTLDVLYRQLAGGQLVDPARHLSPLKKIKVLVLFHRGKYGIDIPEFLKELEWQLRRLLPEQVRQPLDLRIQELQENYDREQEKHKKQQDDGMFAVIIVIAGAMLYSYMKEWKAILSIFIAHAEEWKAILPFIIVLILFIVLMAYIWYLHQWTTPEELLNHVFLSVRGDILETHANPLNSALKSIQLRTFYYVERRHLGRRIEEKLREGVKHSASAIIVFSKEYASSNWCLYELVLILERERTSYYPIIPIYCDGVSYRDLTFENGYSSIYHQALENLKLIYGEQKVNEWKAALQDVGGREAKRATGSESELTTFFKQVAEEIKGKLPRLF